MIVPPKIKKLVESFTDLLRDLRKQHAADGDTSYTAERFKWMRPEKLKEIRNAAQICEPYPLDDLRRDGEKYIDLQGESPSRSDYAVLDLETSLLNSYGRAFNERYTAKQRFFSHSAGVSRIIAEEETGIIDQIQTHAVSLLQLE